jgi:hypothetical protein
MFYNDHAPPHFHVRYGGQRALIGIEALAVLEGKLTPKALGLIVEWASLHQEELRADWERARRQEPLQPIAPLE